MHLDFDPEPDVCFLTYAKFPKVSRVSGPVGKSPGRQARSNQEPVRHRLGAMFAILLPAWGLGLRMELLFTVFSALSAPCCAFLMSASSKTWLCTELQRVERIRDKLDPNPFGA